jgi:hypothetical protein
MVKNNDEYGFLIPENHQIHENAIQAMSFRDQVKFLFGEGLSDDETIAAIKARRWDQNQSNRFVMAIKEVLNQGKLSDDEAIAKIKELSEQSQLLSEIGDILRMANGECFDYRRFKQEEKIVVNGFRRLCDIHLALFKKRSEYEIYGSRIIDDLLNSEDLQAQKQAYDQEEIKRIDKAERGSFDSLRELCFAIAEMLGVNNDKEMVAKIKELVERQEYAKESLAAIADCLDLPSDSTQFGIRFGIIKLLEEIEKLKVNQNEFRDQVNVHTTGNPSKIAEAIQKELLRNESIQEEYEKAPHYDPQEKPEVCDDSELAKDREIERLNRCISGIASFLDLPSGAKQPDICFAIMELRQKYKKISREPSSYEQIVIVDWIARLVGK